MWRTKKSVDVAAKSFSFGFAPHLTGEYGNPSEEAGEDPTLQSLVAHVSELIGGQAYATDDFVPERFMAEFPGLCSSTLGTAVCPTRLNC
jgi:hypothetical protein